MLMSVVYMCVSLFGLLFILYFSMVSMVYVLLLSEVGGSVGGLYCVPLVFGVCV